MTVRTMMLPALVALLAIGCGSEDQLRRVEQEVGDLKLEVFKLRQAVDDGNKKAQAEQQSAAEARTQDRRFQADLQESLRQVQDTTRVLNNRLNSPVKVPARTAAADPPPATTVSAEDERAFNAAVLDYNRGNYPLAAEGLDTFLTTYPQSAKRPEALFFLGLCHYNLRAYLKAQPAFERIIKDHAASPQFLPAKLKRAQCLLKQGLKPAAVKAFRELVDGFSGSAEARTAQQELSDLGL
ncbi:MAG: tetratricopeptide repeat protein [Holophagaceae bacterium]|uniref:Tetratricopeptide repeat protein n=1 Tax=Candidatus Geothrix skivensis TaxID=2954439 RepID=A0A9D7SIB1_9BACT|nr:tetratricopeptide repeat protein [Candidatus Geothrix skivensis]